MIKNYTFIYMLDKSSLLLQYGSVSSVVVSASPTSSLASPAARCFPGAAATPAPLVMASTATPAHIAAVAATAAAAAAVVDGLLAGYQVHALVLLGSGEHQLGHGRESLLAHVDRVHRPQVDSHLLETGPGADHPHVPDPLPKGEVLQIPPTGL